MTNGSATSAAPSNGQDQQQDVTIGKKLYLVIFRRNDNDEEYFDYATEDMITDKMLLRAYQQKEKECMAKILKSRTVPQRKRTLNQFTFDEEDSEAEESEEDQPAAAAPKPKKQRGTDDAPVDRKKAKQLASAPIVEDDDEEDDDDDIIRPQKQKAPAPVASAARPPVPLPAPPKRQQKKAPKREFALQACTNCHASNQTCTRDKPSCKRCNAKGFLCIYPSDEGAVIPEKRGTKEQKEELKRQAAASAANQAGLAVKERAVKQTAAQVEREFIPRRKLKFVDDDDDFPIPKKAAQAPSAESGSAAAAQSSAMQDEDWSVGPPPARQESPAGDWNTSGEWEPQSDSLPAAPDIKRITPSPLQEQMDAAAIVAPRLIRPAAASQTVPQQQVDGRRSPLPQDLFNAHPIVRPASQISNPPRSPLPQPPKIFTYESRPVEKQWEKAAPSDNFSQAPPIIRSQQRQQPPAQQFAPRNIVEEDRSYGSWDIPARATSPASLYLQQQPQPIHTSNRADIDALSCVQRIWNIPAGATIEAVKNFLRQSGIPDPLEIRFSSSAHDPCVFVVCREEDKSRYRALHGAPWNGTTLSVRGSSLQEMQSQAQQLSYSTGTGWDHPIPAAPLPPRPPSPRSAFSSVSRPLPPPAPQTQSLVQGGPVPSMAPKIVSLKSVVPAPPQQQRPVSPVPVPLPPPPPPMSTFQMTQHNLAPSIYAQQPLAQPMPLSAPLPQSSIQSHIVPIAPSAFMPVQPLQISQHRSAGEFINDIINPATQPVVLNIFDPRQRQMAQQLGPQPVALQQLPLASYSQMQQQPLPQQPLGPPPSISPFGTIDQGQPLGPSPLQQSVQGPSPATEPSGLRKIRPASNEFFFSGQIIYVKDVDTRITVNCNAYFIEGENARKSYGMTEFDSIELLGMHDKKAIPYVSKLCPIDPNKITVIVVSPAQTSLHRGRFKQLQDSLAKDKAVLYVSENKPFRLILASPRHPIVKEAGFEHISGADEEYLFGLVMRKSQRPRADGASSTTPTMGQGQDQSRPL